MVILAMCEEKVDPSVVPAGEDSHRDENVALGLRTDSYWMCDSPFSRGTAVMEWNKSSTAKPIPTLSLSGMGPRVGIEGVFLNCWQMPTVLMTVQACPSIVATALPPIASRFARRSNMTYVSSNPSSGGRLSKFSIQQPSHWNGIDAWAPLTPWLIRNIRLSCLYH
jgi:hypothetical protein